MKRNNQIHFFLDDLEYRRFLNRVKKSGLSLSAYIRHLIKDRVPQDTPPPEYEEVLKELRAIGRNMNQIALVANATGILDADKYDERYDKLISLTLNLIKATELPRGALMATTSIWPVKGYLGKVVVYIENPEKTGNPALFEKPDMTDRECQRLDDVIEYASNNEKTAMKQFVTGIGCNISTAREEMLVTKQRFEKEGAGSDFMVTRVLRKAR